MKTEIFIDIVGQSARLQADRPVLVVCRLSSCVAGNCNLQVKEEDLKETLELLAERLGHFTGRSANQGAPAGTKLSMVMNACITMKDGRSVAQGTVFCRT